MLEENMEKTNAEVDVIQPRCSCPTCALTNPHAIDNEVHHEQRPRPAVF